MEPAEGPGALDFHGDEEIIEVVELGPPGPGETGPASSRGTGPPRPKARFPRAGLASRPHPQGLLGTFSPPRWGLLRPRGRDPFALGRPWARGG